MAQPVVEIDKVGKIYYTGDVETPVLFDLSFAIVPGEFVAIVGGSGSGKTTLLNLMGLLDRPTSGVIRVEGREVSNLDELGRARMRRDRLGFIFQFHYLLPEFTVLENALMPCRMRGREFEKSREARMRELLTCVGLEDKLNVRPPQLSGGQQQRVAVVRSLANDPAVVFADEPTGNLDSATGDRIGRLLFDLNAEAKTTLVLVTHERDLAARCDRTIRIDAGKVEADQAEAGRVVA